MIDYAENDGGLTFQVRVVPRASRSEVVGEYGGALRVRVAAAPVEGAANDELVRTLARELEVSRNAIEITAGHSSKLKKVRVTGVQPRALEKWQSPQSLSFKS
jgi:uncharacterized protein (TIGR00251 family)